VNCSVRVLLLLECCGSVPWCHVRHVGGVDDEGAVMTRAVCSVLV
jgi:hypothetical protein